MDTRPRAMPRAPSSRSPNVVASPAGGATAVATSASSSSLSAGRGPSSTTLGGTGNQPPRSQESYHAFAQREEAARILQSYEKLSWYSYARCESLAQTRLHFRNLVAGFTPQDEAAHRDYTEDLAPLPLPLSGKSPEDGGRREEENIGGGGKGSRKGKERASLPGAATGGGESPARGAGSAPSSAAGKKKKRRSEG